MSRIVFDFLCCNNAPMNNWDDFQLILALYRASTIRGAATILHVNHSTVSRRLSQIQNKHKTVLFEKSKDGYQATKLGMSLVDNAQKIEDIVYASARELDSTESVYQGDLSLSIPDAIGQYLLMDDISQFCMQYPDINLQVHSTYALADLNKNQADVVVRGTNNPPEHLVGHRLFPYYLCCYAHKEYLSNTERDNLRWICAPYDGEQKPDWIKQTQYADIQIGMQLADITLRHLALLNMKGLARGACYMADQYPELVRLPSSEPEPIADLWVLTHPDLRHNLKVKALMEHLTKAIRRQESLIVGRLYDKR